MRIYKLCAMHRIRYFMGLRALTQSVIWVSSYTSPISIDVGRMHFTTCWVFTICARNIWFMLTITFTFRHIQIQLVLLQILHELHFIGNYNDQFATNPKSHCSISNANFLNKVLNFALDSKSLCLCINLL